MDLTEIVNSVIKNPYLPYYYLTGAYIIGLCLLGRHFYKQAKDIERQYKPSGKNSISTD